MSLLDRLRGLFRKEQPLPDPTFTSVVRDLETLDVAETVAFLEEKAPAIRQAVENAKPPAKKKRKKRRRPKRRFIRFDKLVQRVARRYGAQMAAQWAKTVLKHQATINVAALETALASRNVKAIEAVVGPAALQQKLERDLAQILYGNARAAAEASTHLLNAHGFAASFNVSHPNSILFARQHAAEMVVGIPVQTQQVIAEIVARGQAGFLTVDDQARAIREVVGLPPHWARAVHRLEDEIRNGDVRSAISRRLSASMKAKIKNRIRTGNATPAFIREAAAAYSASLVNLRAITIARTESLRASHFGVQESWVQARQQGALPRSIRRWWIVTLDERLSLKHRTIPGLNPNGRRLDEPFLTTEGPCMYPPSRPNCRCSVALGFQNPQRLR